MTPTEIEGLVSRLRAYKHCDHRGDPDLDPHPAICDEAADALSQTIPRTDSVDAVIDDYLGGLRWQASDAGAHNDKKGAEHARIKIEAINELRSMLATIPRTTDEGMREILAEECTKAGALITAADLRNKHSSRVPDSAALAAMRRVSKTDEGRNAVIEECARAAHAKRSECDEAFYETNGSIYTEAYLDGISAAYDAIRALLIEKWRAYAMLAWGEGWDQD